MELFSAIYERRAVHQFLPREVPRETLLRLLDAAVQAPSALNSQPWTFAIFQGPQRLQDYAERAKAHFLATFSAGRDPHTQHQAMLHQPGFDLFYHAPALIVIYARDSGGQFAIGDCCLAAQNLMLAAHGLGLGTCPVGFSQPWLDLAETKGNLGIPIHFTAVLPLAVGFPAGTNPAPGRRGAEVIAWP